MVRVVVTAFESALPDTADSTDSRDTHSNHILTRVPVCKGGESSTVHMDGYMDLSRLQSLLRAQTITNEWMSTDLRLCNKADIMRMSMYNVENKKGDICSITIDDV